MLPPNSPARPSIKVLRQGLLDAGIAELHLRLGADRVSDPVSQQRQSPIAAAENK